MNIGIIGLGLIGGSLARAVRRAGDRAFGSDISDSVTARAELLGAIDGELNDGNFGEMDILIYAVTPAKICLRAESDLKKLKRGAIVTDVAGTKTVVAAKMRGLSEKFRDLEFIAAHPMAGKEYSGINYSSALLFDGASVLVVPVKAEIETLQVFKKFLLGLGFGYVRFTNAEEHDKNVAYTSELPHVISSCYIRSQTAGARYGFSAGSFRDMSRVARLSPELWTELFIENRKNLVFELDGFIERLTKMRQAIAESDADGLSALLALGNAAKEETDRAERAWKKLNKDK